MHPPSDTFKQLKITHTWQLEGLMNHALLVGPVSPRSLRQSLSMRRRTFSPEHPSIDALVRSADVSEPPSSLLTANVGLGALFLPQNYPVSLSNWYF
jgi:hypothetical protein